MKTLQTPLERLRHHVSGAIERDEATPIAGQPSTPGKLTKLGKQWEAEQQKASVNADEQFKAAATPAQASGNCRASHSPLPILNNAVDYIRSLKSTQPGYADKVQSAVDQLVKDVEQAKAISKEWFDRWGDTKAHAQRLADATRQAIEQVRQAHGKLNSDNQHLGTAQRLLCEALAQWEGSKS